MACVLSRHTRTQSATLLRTFAMKWLERDGRCHMTLVGGLRQDVALSHHEHRERPYADRVHAQDFHQVLGRREAAMKDPLRFHVALLAA